MDSERAFGQHRYKCGSYLYIPENPSATGSWIEKHAGLRLSEHCRANLRLAGVPQPCLSMRYRWKGSPTARTRLMAVGQR